MFVSFLALFLWSWGLLLVANKDVLEPDWRDFQKHSDINRDELVNFIRNFPIQTYWDTLKGEYRTGALGENVKDITVPTHLSLLTWVDRQILQNGKVIKIKQPIVDQNLLFMLMLVVVQDMSELSEHLLHVSGGYEAKYNFQSMIELIRNQNFTSTADSEAALKIAELEAKLVSLQRNVQERRIAFNLLSENEQTMWKQQARSSVHQKLLKQLEESVSRINMIYNEKWSKLQQSMENSAYSAFELEKLSIEKEFAESLQDLEEEIQTTFAIIRFRAEEEKKSFALIEDIATRVAVAQMNSQQESVDEILTVLSTEIANMVQEIVRDPWFIWLWGRMILGIVIGTVFVIELSRSLHILFYHWQRKSKRLYSQQQVLPSWWRRILGSDSPNVSNQIQLRAKEERRLQNISSGDHVVEAMEEESLMVFSRNVCQRNSCTDTKKMDLGTCNRDKLLLITRELYVAIDVHTRPYINTYAAFVPFQATPLPNLLFCGPAGCGKSETAKLLAQYICQDKRSGHEKYSGYIVFSGADLLALGDQAGQYVRDLFQKYHSTSKSNSAQNKTTLLIIDEADEIICTRDKLPLSFLMNARKPSSLVNEAALGTVPPELETPEANTIPSTHGSNDAFDQSLIINDTWERQMHSNNTAPHHVLYSLLEGLRSPNTSLGVIFTTRLNVTQVDPAFLDRMDHVLVFPRPSPFDTLRYLLSHFLDTIGEFSSHVEAIQSKIETIKRDEQLQQQLLEPVLTGDVWKICRPLFLLDSNKDVNTSEFFRDDVSVTSNFSESSSGSRRQSLRLMKRSVLTSQSNEPSNVRPTPRMNTGNEENRSKFQGSKIVSPIQQFLHDHEKDLLNKASLQGTFAWESCLQMLILHACRLSLPSVGTNDKKGKRNTSTALESWSYRDFHKFLMNIRFATLCSDSCQVTTYMWLEELLRSE